MSTLERVIVVILSAAMLLICARATMTSGIRAEVQMHEARRDERAARVAALDQNVARLLTEVNQLADNPHAVERRVRDELHWTKPDEIVLDFGAEPVADVAP